MAANFENRHRCSISQFSGITLGCLHIFRIDSRLSIDVISQSQNLSNHFYVVILLSPAPTAPPTNIAINRLNSTHMNVTWMPISLEEARGFITNYTVTYEPAPSTGGPQKRDNDRSSVTVKGTMAVIGGLSPNLAYSVTVRANTAAGMGVASEPTTVSGTSPDE